MRETPGARIAEIRSDGEADSLRMQARVSLAEIVVREALAIGELRVPFTWFDRRNLFKEALRVCPCRVIEERQRSLPTIRLIRRSRSVWILA